MGMILLALLLSAGHWGSVFLADRLWEASVAERVAVAGARLALLSLALELSVLILAVVWFCTFISAREAVSLRG